MHPILGRSWTFPKPPKLPPADIESRRSAKQKLLLPCSKRLLHVDTKGTHCPLHLLIPFSIPNICCYRKSLKCKFLETKAKEGKAGQTASEEEDSDDDGDETDDSCVTYGSAPDASFSVYAAGMSSQVVSVMI